MNITKSFERQPQSAVKLSVTVAKDDVVNEYNEIIKKYVKNASIPGFRKGHAPQALLESKFGKALEEEAINTLIEESFKQIIEDKEVADEFKPLAYSRPKLNEEPTFKKDADFTYTITYDTQPKVALGELKDITVELDEAEVSDSDLQEELKAIQMRNATVKTKGNDETIAMGDIVNVDFVELEAGTDKENDKREGFTFETGTKENIYDFDGDIIGLKKGDTKVITKTYGEDAFNDLKGKTLTLRVKINEIKVRDIPPIDDELAQDVSEEYKTVEDLKKSVMSDLQKKCEEALKAKKEQAMVDAIVAKYDFELPQSMVAMEVSYNLQQIADQFRVDIKKIGQLFSLMGQDPNTAIENIRKNVITSLKGRLVIDNLIAKYDIKVSDEELEAKFDEIATERKTTKEEVKKSFEDANGAQNLQYLKIDMCDQKLYDTLYKEMKIKKGKKLTLKELTNTDED